MLGAFLGGFLAFGIFELRHAVSASSLEHVANYVGGRGGGGGGFLFLRGGREGGGGGGLGK